MPLAAQAPLNEAEAVRRLLARSDLEALWLLPEAQAQAQRMETGLWSNPGLDLTRERPNGPAGPRREESLILSQSVDLSGRRGLRREAADRRLLAARGDRDAFRAELVQRARHAFHQTLLHQERLKRLEGAVDRTSRLAAALERQEQLGEASGADRRRAARELDGLRARLAQERVARQRAEGQLKVLVPGEGASLALEGVLVPEAPPPLAQMLARLPEAPAQVRAEQDAGAWKLEAQASRRWLPEVVLGAGVKRWEEGGLKGSAGTLSLGLTLPAWNRGQAQRLRTEAEARAAQARATLARDETQIEAQALWREASELGDSAREILGRAETETPKLLKGADAAFEAGESSLFELLDVQRSALEIDLQALDLAFAARRARLDLDRLLGRMEP